MKKFLLGAAAAAMTLTGFAASAQTYGGGHNPYYTPYSGYSQHHDGYRDGDHDRYRFGRGDYDHDRYARGGGWRTGQYYSGYDRRDRMIHNWRAYNLPAPRPGYSYYRDDNGDVVMAALASGLIGLVIGGALSNHDNSYSTYGYQQPYGAYQQPYGYYQQPYSYGTYGYPY